MGEKGLENRSRTRNFYRNSELISPFNSERKEYEPNIGYVGPPGSAARKPFESQSQSTIKYYEEGPSKVVETTNVSKELLICRLARIIPLRQKPSR